ncbi:MAG: hypothetical protein ABI718_18515, partial [Acidobacteriota bacterium]
SSAAEVTMTMTATIATDTTMLISPPESMTAAKSTPDSSPADAGLKETSTEGAPEASATPAVPAGQSASAGGGGDEVTVTLTDYRIDMPAIIRPGKSRLRIFNRGKTSHGLKVAGNGIEEKLWITVGPGQNATLNVDLPPGSYNVWCPVDHHDRKGMRLTIKVSN